MITTISMILKNMKENRKKEEEHER